jgi:tRNA pseudouridine38-40 synthase
MTGFKYAALISYVGTRFCGWQTQIVPGAAELPSIQSTIEAAILRMTGEDVSVVGSGRTDSGVHALGQVAHFVLKKKEWEPRVLFNGLNFLLRPDIQVRHIQAVPLDFHAQRSAIQKQYGYYFQQGACALPHLEPYSWWIRKKLDLDAMNEALSYLVGERDFLPFRAKGAKPGSTVRTIFEAEAVYEPLQFPGMGQGLGFVRVRVRGSGFLKQMVRGIAGTLLQVGERRREATCTRDILASQDRSAVGPTAPSRALWLEKVWYPEELHFH